MTTDSGDIIADACKCKTLARYVSERIHGDETLRVQLKDVSVFDWASQPQVK